MVSLGYMRFSDPLSRKKKKRVIEWRVCKPGPPPQRISWLDWVTREGWSRDFRQKIIDKIK